MGHGGSGVSVSNGGRLPPKRFLGNSTTSRGHSGGAESWGHSESAKLDRTSGDEGELGGTSGDEGELGWTGWGADSASSWDGAASGADSASSWDGAASGADSASSWDGAASGADSASSWDGAASGADSASSWDGAASGQDLGMPALRTDTSGGSNTLAISPGPRGASAAVVAILVTDVVSRSSSVTPTVTEEPAHSKA